MLQVLQKITQGIEQQLMSTSSNMTLVKLVEFANMYQFSMAETSFREASLRRFQILSNRNLRLECLHKRQFITLLEKGGIGPGGMVTKIDSLLTAGNYGKHPLNVQKAWLSCTCQCFSKTYKTVVFSVNTGNYLAREATSSSKLI